MLPCFHVLQHILTNIVVKGESNILATEHLEGKKLEQKVFLRKSFFSKTFFLFVSDELGRNR